MKLRKGPVIAALHPVGFLIAQLGFAILCAAILSSVLWPLHPILGIFGWGIIWLILAVFQKYDGKIFAHYIMQDYAHTARHRGAYEPELSTRLDAFGHNIERALREGYDEVLVVSHSSGAPLTNLGFMITFRSLQDQVHCVIAFRNVPNTVVSWRRPRDMEGRNDTREPPRASGQNKPVELHACLSS